MKTAAQLQQEVTDLKAEIKNKNTYIQTLESVIKDMNRHKFGSSSEKQNSAQIPLFNEAEELTTAKPKSKVRGKKKKAGIRKPLPVQLERIEQIHDIRDDQNNCPNDGAPLIHVGDETSEQLLYIPASFKVIKHKRYKYACPKCNKHIITADKPADPIPKSVASPELLSYVTVSKYTDGLPLYRLSELFKRLNIAISRTNLASWMIKCGALVQPLINMLEDKMFEQPMVHMDETTVQVLNEPGKKASSKSYMWVRRAANIILFDYSPSRSATVAKKILTGFNGTIMTDGYGGYDQLTNNKLGCWAHARRYFIKVLDQAEHQGARDMVNLIGELYQIEQQIKESPPDKRSAIRQAQSAAVLEKIKALKDASLQTCTPTSTFGKALGYLHNQWPKLIGYIERGEYPIDNNAAENAIRPFVIGRKNWLFANSTQGAKASANLYGLIETAKAHNLNPEKYLTQVYRELPNAKTVEQIEAMLPWNIKLE
jgi:transposase